MFNFSRSSLFTRKSAVAVTVAVFVSFVGIMSVRGGLSATPTHRRIKHVLLISLDGLHALDLANFVKSNPQSNLAQLSSRGITYT
jgi:predicted AlkP superfamily pyrophosphatase or phosphodiesterase